MNFFSFLSLCCFLIIIRVFVGIFGYSGYQKPPMFGDFEAQRHWLEITTSLNIEDWYRNTNDNNLLYWGLDYPPLTAYVSYIFGIIAHYTYPDLVILHQSRGHESLYGKIFMRTSVIICDFIIFIPAVYLLLNKKYKLQNFQILLLLLLISCLPSLILIDHGHFQYNSVSIGLTLFAAHSILQENYILGSIFFCLSLNFKQMTLYYSPVFFFSLLRKCYEKGFTSSHLKSFHFFSAFKQLFVIGSTVILTFAALWLPFCSSLSSDHTCPQALYEILFRLFPFARGIFEDKVSNIWYLLSIPLNFNTSSNIPLLVKFSLALTLLLLSPVMIALLKRQLTPLLFLQSLIVSSLAFFLASFQVHEKSLLLSLVPASFLLFDSSSSLFDMSWFQIVGTMTLFPLLIKDGHRITYWIMLGCFIILLIWCRTNLSNQNNQLKGTSSSKSTLGVIFSYLRNLYLLISITGFIVLHILEIYIPPPERYPDLHPALFAIFGCCNLLWYYFYFTVWMLNKGEEKLE